MFVIICYKVSGWVQDLIWKQESPIFSFGSSSSSFFVVFFFFSHEPEVRRFIQKKVDSTLDILLGLHEKIQEKSSFLKPVANQRNYS